MRRVWFLAVGCIALAACADILGIDDGVPRAYDASTDAGSDADAPDAAANDAAFDGPFSPLSCGATTCNFAIGQSCCRSASSTYACVDAPDACAGTDIPCDRPSQCPSTEAGAEICCTTDILTDSGTYVADSVGCHAAAQCSPIPTHYILCGDDSGADCPPEAGCGPSVSTLPPFLLCK
jgi:hypothetical protein